MASLHKDPLQRSPYFYCKFRNSDGRISFKSTKKKKRDEAWNVCLGWADAARRAATGELTEVQARKVVSEIVERAGGAAISFLSTKDFCERWLTSKEATKTKGTVVRYRGVLDNFQSFIGEKKAASNIASITAADIEAFRDNEVRSGKTQSTANFGLKAVKSVFYSAKRQGLILQNPGDPVESFAAVKEERDVFTAEQIRALVKGGKGTDWDGMILLACYTGARLSDCATMRWENVDLQNGVIHFHPGKTSRGNKRKEVICPIAGELMDYLLTRKSSDEPKAYLFPNLAKMPTHGSVGLSASFRKLMVQAGVVSELGEEKTGKGRQFRRLVFHSLRHTFNSTLANQGVSIELRRELTGHSSDAMNRKYTHFDLAPLKAAIEKMPKLLKPPKAKRKKA
jgi:integrase